MPENLIHQISAIEKEADSIVKQAHDEAAAQERDADRRLEQLQAQLEKQYLEQVQEITRQTAKEREAQQAELRQRFQSSLNAVKGIKVEEAKGLIDKVAERISNS